MTRSSILIVVAAGVVLAFVALAPLTWAQAPPVEPAGAAPAAGPAKPAGDAAAPAASSGSSSSGLAFLFPLLLFLIFGGCIALMYTEGIWSNAIRLISVVSAALLATNFWEPLAKFLEDKGGSFSYYWDLLALWGLFALLILIFRSVTSAMSKVRVKFLKIADDIGGVVLAVCVAWVMICFITFTLHTAPLARNFMFGGFDPDSRMLMGLAPDRQWLAFTRTVSRGTFCRYASESEMQQRAYGGEGDQKLCVFDADARFIPKYAARRAALEKAVAEKGSTRVEGGAPKR